VKNKEKKVFVGISGGVDSAVSAALLKKQGYDVTGVFIKAWTPQGYPCSWKEDRRSAMRVAAVLDIPFLTLDLSKEYKKEVVDYMIAEYKKGKTPNPDVMCNKEIKFGHFLKFALKNGADFVATGHYARRYENHAKATKSYENSNEVLETLPFGEGRVRLLEGADKNKDQSYFLWTLTQNQLKHTLFPIGHLQKSEVRKLAKKFGLPQAVRKDSQGVCFLGKVDMKEFLKEHVGAKKGGVLNMAGEKIGEHNGAILYTIGERHGFSVANKNTGSEPLYVVAKDIKKNTITVGSKTSPQIYTPTKLKTKADPLSIIMERGHGGEVVLKNINLINSTPIKNLSCRIRYRGEKIGCKMDGKKIIFNKPQSDIASGQSLVLYEGEKCLGGGIIKG